MAKEGRFNPLNYEPEFGTLGMNGVPLKWKKTSYGDSRKRGVSHPDLKSGDIDQYRYFSKRPGDGLEGHEIWQSSNTAVHGLGGRTGTLGGRNPAIALSNKDHKIVNAIQRQIIRSSHEISPLDNIKMNIQVLRETQKRGVNVTNAQIKEAGRKAVRFYERMKSEGHLN